MEEPINAVAPSLDLTERRIAVAVHVARYHRTSIRASDLADLLPDPAPRSASELGAWLNDHPTYGRLVGEHVVPAGPAAPAEVPAERRARGEQYWAEAQSTWSGSLRSVHPLVACAGVTGSTAYGEPEAGDDTDFLVVTRPGAVWLVLGMIFLLVRRESSRRRVAPPDRCFNFVIDTRVAEREFSTPRGLLVAREALTTRVLQGEPSYRRLLAASRWMRSELPRLFDRWEASGAPDPMPARPVPWVLRIANAALFPWLAAVLQVQSLVRNRRLRVTGREDRAYRTTTEIGRLAYVSQRFDQLALRYAVAEGRETPT